MKNKARQTVVSLLFFAALYLACTFPRQANYPCARTTTLILSIQHMGYAYFATGSRPDSSATSLYINKTTGDWLIISSDFDMHSCITDQGKGWSWALSISPI